MRSTLVRSFRKTVRAIARRVQVDNVAKALTIGDWTVPFEWLLDRDIHAFDVNSQRGCVICPDLADGLQIESVEDHEAEGNVSIAWRSATEAVVPTPPGSIPCVPPLKSVIEVDGLHTSTSSYTHKLLPRIAVESTGTDFPVESRNTQSLWVPSSFPSLASSGTSAGDLSPPSEARVPNFNHAASTNARRLVQTVERFGFAVAEDESLSRSDASTSTELVQKRCDAAEKVITDTFTILRNSHYGAMSTWSDGDSWKEVGVTFGEGTSSKPSSSQSQSVTEFRESPSHMDGAYLSSLLDLHTDCTYFVDCPKVQAFGCIFTTPRTVGGETTLADGFQAAEQLREEDPVGFELLTRVLVGGRYKKEGRWYEAYRPVLTLSPDGSHIRQITFNNSDRIPLPAGILSFEETRQFYRAYYKFHVLVHENSIRFLLKPGQILFFDNHRVLHGRLQFCGPRVMCGAYIATDEYYSALRSANAAAKVSAGH